MVLGKLSDGRHYEAMVVGVDEELNEYEVVFTGYKAIQKLPGADLKEAKEGQARQTLLSSKEVTVGEIKPVTETVKKRDRKVKKVKSASKRDLEDKERTAAWQKFSAKTKKGMNGISKKTTSSSTITSRTKHVYD